MCGKPTSVSKNLCVNKGHKIAFQNFINTSMLKAMSQI